MAGNEIVIEEVGGTRPIRVVLRGRAMPYRGIETPGTQRVQTTWYAGNPKATQQILGATLEPTTLNGRWKSKYIRIGYRDAGADVEIENAPEVLSAASGVVDDNPAGLVVSLFERLRDRGKEIRFTWGEVIRYGTIAEFRPTWDRPEDVGWSLTVAWNGTTERAPRSSRTASLGQGVRTALVRTDDALVRMPRAMDLTAAQRLINKMESVRASVLGVIGYSRIALGVALIPARVVQGLAAAVVSVRQEVEAVAYDTLAVSYETVTSLDTVTNVFAVEDFRRSVGVEASIISARAIREREDMRALRADLTGAQTHRVEDGETLRRIAAAYYGSADAWTAIAEANDLDSSDVATGTLLFIPPRQAKSSGGGEP